MTEQPPKRRGRPPGSTAEPSVVTSIRLPASLAPGYRALGGSTWVVQALRKALKAPK